MNTRENLKDDRVVEWLKGTDGYAILHPRFFAELGLEFKSRTFSSDPELGKHSASRKDGKPGDVEGVAEFDAIEDVADLLGIPNDVRSPWLGRGKNFRHLAALICANLGTEEEPDEKQ